MPYIITTRRRTSTPEGFDPPLTRRAVATLEEARGYAAEQVRGALGVRKSWSIRKPEALALGLPEHGGTIGPLPDGTTIEVTPVCWNWIIGAAEDAGVDTDAVHADGDDIAILDAYNAQENA